MRISERQLNPSLKKQLVSVFAQVVADTKNLQEAESFLTSFFNDAELETYSKRLSIVYWLKKKRSYENIKENLKVSSATIATIQSLSEKPGIKLALTKIEAEEWANQWADKIKKFVRK